ncbi:hypothetical protein [Sphingomonas sp. ACRSK]|uniref:hypothetical protein n=1 Tax=Sphingomonas sp. ACRSK TaxID=2918213 RepID=UPI001EF5C124|nr:hypothetical protein [Sphingomonas sp. ACRSK]MCG7348878.1 hypothetical protein [Sphingomonas sp. ACRSK]
MKIRIPAGAAALHACSTLTGQTVLTREGALLCFTSDEGLDLEGTLVALKAADDSIGEAILATDNEALIAGMTDLRRLTLGMERDVRYYFELRAAISGTKPTVTDTGSQPTSTGDAAISTSQTQSSVDNEEIEHEPPQPSEPQQQPRRKRG